MKGMDGLSGSSPVIRHSFEMTLIHWQANKVVLVSRCRLIPDFQPVAQNICSQSRLGALHCLSFGFIANP